MLPVTLVNRDAQGGDRLPVLERDSEIADFPRQPDQAIEIEKFLEIFPAPLQDKEDEKAESDQLPVEVARAVARIEEDVRDAVGPGQPAVLPDKAAAEARRR